MMKNESGGGGGIGCACLHAARSSSNLMERRGFEPHPKKSENGGGGGIGCACLRAARSGSNLMEQRGFESHSKMSENGGRGGIRRIFCFSQVHNSPFSLVIKPTRELPAHY
jgi:hypothetical protein